jgi:hypothetical protein
MVTKLGMKRRCILQLMIGIGLLTATACGDFLDVNKDPVNPTVEEVPAHNRLVGAITTTNGAAQWRGAREVAAICQYASTEFTAGSRIAAETWDMNASYFLWQNAYTWTIPNCVDMALLGEKEGSPHFIGAGKTLLALNFGMLTDQYGRIVVTDAYDGVSQVKLEARFDEQEVVYQQIQQLLDDAIQAFDQPNNKTPLNFSGGDIMYQGSVDKWRRFAWSLKARYLNHLSKKKSLYDPARIIEACQNGFNADGMDAEFPYLEGGQVTDENPWYSWGGFGNPKDLRYFAFTQFFVDLLTKLPVTDAVYQDPRIGIIMSPAKSDGKFRGLRPGFGLAGGEGGTGTKTSRDDYGPFSNGGFYTKKTSPFPFITYSEVKLIEAEARLRSGDAGGALLAYEEGVKANMRKLKVPADTITKYWTKLIDNGVATHFADPDLTKGLSHIMRQKYITQCLNPETWVDMRRMDYSQAIYGPSLQKPGNINKSVFSQTNPDEWIRAMVYETNEQARNTENVGENSPQVRLKTPVWWDRPE